MITTRIKDGIATITMSDCQLLTRCDPGEGRALADALQSAGDDDGVRAIVLLAQGRDFCAPARPVRPQQAGLPEIQAVYAGVTGVYQSLAYCRKVVIMGIQGMCAGAGSALALCADFVVMGRSARIQSPFARVPEASFALAALIMRLNRAKGWILSEEAMSAIQAEEAGLANRVVPEGQLRREALGMARSAARMPLDGIAISKVMMEIYLDSQGVGKEFDHAHFYRSAMLQAEPAAAVRVPTKRSRPAGGRK